MDGIRQKEVVTIHSMKMISWFLIIKQLNLMLSPIILMMSLRCYLNASCRALDVDLSRNPECQEDLMLIFCIARNSGQKPISFQKIARMHGDSAYTITTDCRCYNGQLRWQKMMMNQYRC